MSREARIIQTAETLLAIARPGIICAVSDPLSDLEVIADKARQLADERGLVARIAVRGEFVAIELESDDVG